MKIREVFSLRKNKILMIVLAGAILAGGFNVAIRGASANNGDFAENVRTTISVVDKNSDGSRKVDYLTGESITIESRVEVGNEGEGKSYPGAYLLVKIPSQYLDKKDMSAASMVSKVEQYADGGYHVFKMSYDMLSAGSIHSNTGSFSLKNLETPEGYKPEIIHELYSGEGVLLSRQSTEINSTKAERLINNDGASINGDSASGNGLRSVVVAEYANNTDDTINNDSWSRFPDVVYASNISIASRGSSSGNGLRKLIKTTVETKLPEGVILTQESIDDGWVVSGGVARKIIEYKGTETLGSVTSSLKFRYTDKSGDTIDKEWPIETKYTVEYDGGHILERTIKSRIKPIAVRPGVAPKLELRKYLNHTSGFVTSSRVSAENLNMANGDSRYRYYIAVDVTSSGAEKGIPLSSISDTLKDDRERIRRVQLTASRTTIAGAGIRRYDVWATPEGGQSEFIETVEIADDASTSSKYVSLPDDKNYTSVEARFVDGTVLPDKGSQGGEKYSITLFVETSLRDAEAEIKNAANSEDGIIRTTDTGRVVSGDDNSVLEASATRAWAFNPVEMINRIVSTHKSPILHVGTKVRFETFNVSYPRAGELRTYGFNALTIGAVERSLALYTADLGLGESARKCIDDGRCAFVENYKGTGKNALIFEPSSFSASGFTKSFVDGLFVVSELTANGEKEIELITVNDKNNPRFYTRSDNDLDFRDDGDTSASVARSSTKFHVLTPEQVAIKKYVRRQGTDFTESVGGLYPGDSFDWRISVINLSDRELPASRVLDVLPKVGDNKVVEGADGQSESRGSTTGFAMTGPIAEVEGFTISYSIDEPGATQAESWSKTFVSADKVADWSKVRMIKIEQNAGYILPAQTVKHFVVSGKIPDDAKAKNISMNSAAVAISATGRLVESNIVTAEVVEPTIVRGVYFEDKNANGKFNEGTDDIVSGVKVELLDNKGNVVAETTTDAEGKYQFVVKNEGQYSVRFSKVDDVRNVVSRGKVSSDVDSHAGSFDRNDVTKTDIFSVKLDGSTIVRNLGIEAPRGNVTAFYYIGDITDPAEPGRAIAIKPMEIVKRLAPVGEKYEAPKPSELEYDGLAYSLKGLHVDSDPDTGIVEGNKTVIFMYLPKPGGEVNAKFINADGKEIASPEVIKKAGSTVGEAYSSKNPLEIVFEGITYVYQKLEDNSAPQAGKVVEGEQTVVYVYAPKKGGSVFANFVSEDGDPLANTDIVAENGTPVGTAYTSNNPNEIDKDGLKYIFKEIKDGSSPTDGVVAEESQEVVYVYSPKKGGEVIAKFVDEDGKDLQDAETVAEKDTQVGTAYTSANPEEIEKDGLKYIFKELDAASAETTGKVIEGSQEIVYVYAPKAGEPVLIRMIDQDGNLLDDGVVAEKGLQVGVDYKAEYPETIEKNGRTYKIKVVRSDDGDAAIEGKITEETQIITVIYEIQPLPEVSASESTASDNSNKSTFGALSPNTGFEKTNAVVAIVSSLATFATLSTLVFLVMKRQ